MLHFLIIINLKTYLISIRARSMKITIGIHHDMALSAATHRSHFLYSGTLIVNQVSTHSLFFMTFRLAFLTFLEMMLHRDDIAQRLKGSFIFSLSRKMPLCHTYRLSTRFRLRHSSEVLIQ